MVLCGVYTVRKSQLRAVILQTSERCRNAHPFFLVYYTCSSNLIALGNMQQWVYHTNVMVYDLQDDGVHESA